MRRSFAILVLTLFALLCGPALARAQECNVLCRPVFVLLPGIVTYNFLNAPAGVTAETHFNILFGTAIPTAIPRTTLGVLVTWTPFNTVETSPGQPGFRANAPAIVMGPIFTLVDTPWFTINFDVLDGYGPAARPEDRAAYTHKLVLEGDLFLKLGPRIFPAVSGFSALSAYAFLVYVATGLPEQASPWIFYGASHSRSRHGRRRTRMKPPQPTWA